MVPSATVSAVAGALLKLDHRQSRLAARIVANPGSDRMRSGLIRAAVPNSSATLLRIILSDGAPLSFGEIRAPALPIGDPVVRSLKPRFFSPDWA
jgi:hypothetical protein